MKRFLTHNKGLTGILIVSVLIVVLYLLSIDQPEWFLHAGEWFGALFQLAIGFIINFLFYVTQVYLPQQKQKKYVNQCINKRIDEIILDMETIYIELARRYIEDYSNRDLTYKDIDVIYSKLNFEDRVAVISLQKSYLPMNDPNINCTVRELILTQVKKVVVDIDSLFKYYAQYITPDLMIVLEEVLKSNMHCVLAGVLLQIKHPLSINDSKDDFFKEYFELKMKLREKQADYK